MSRVFGNMCVQKLMIFLYELEVPRAAFSYELEIHPAELGPEIGSGSRGYLE